MGKVVLILALLAGAGGLAALSAWRKWRREDAADLGTQAPHAEATESPMNVRQAPGLTRREGHRVP